VRPPTRALLVEDVESWVSILSRAVRRAGISEIVTCENLQAAREALRKARFDVAILDIGLDEADDLNKDGVKVLEAIREVDTASTRCVLVTGWQGGDRLALASDAQDKFGVDFAFMKEKYDAHALIEKLTELLQQAAASRLDKTPMENLGANMEPFHLETQLINALAPHGGVQTIYTLVSRLLSGAIPLVAQHPGQPIGIWPGDVSVGLYWSRALSTAVAVGLGPAPAWHEDRSVIPDRLKELLPVGVVPELIDRTRERNIQGRLWELPGPGIDRDEFPG
jgi:ActR/RegA family two-component response regulator